MRDHLRAAIDQDRAHGRAFWRAKVARLDGLIAKWNGTGRGRYVSGLRSQLRKAQENLRAIEGEDMPTTTETEGRPDAVAAVRRQITVRVPVELWRRARRVAADRDETLQDLGGAAIRELVERHEARR